VYNDPGKISGDLSHNQHVLLFLCLTVCLSISVPVPSDNATALKGDVQRGEVFPAIHDFRCFRIRSRKASIIFVMLVRPSFRMYQRSSHWKDFREI